MSFTFPCSIALQIPISRCPIKSGLKISFNFRPVLYISIRTFPLHFGFNTSFTIWCQHVLSKYIFNCPLQVYFQSSFTFPSSQFLYNYTFKLPCTFWLADILWVSNSNLPVTSQFTVFLYLSILKGPFHFDLQLSFNILIRVAHTTSFVKCTLS